MGNNSTEKNQKCPLWQGHVVSWGLCSLWQMTTAWVQRRAHQVTGRWNGRWLWSAYDTVLSSGVREMTPAFKARLTAVLSSVLFLLLDNCLCYCMTTCWSQKAECSMIKLIGFQVRPRFKFWFCHNVATWPGALKLSHSLFPSLPGDRSTNLRVVWGKMSHIKEQPRVLLAEAVDCQQLQLRACIQTVLSKWKLRVSGCKREIASLCSALLRGCNQSSRDRSGSCWSLSAVCSPIFNQGLMELPHLKPGR